MVKMRWCNSSARRMRVKRYEIYPRKKEKKRKMGCLVDIWRGHLVLTPWHLWQLIAIVICTHAGYPLFFRLIKSLLFDQQIKSGFDSSSFYTLTQEMDATSKLQRGGIIRIEPQDSTLLTNNESIKDRGLMGKAEEDQRIIPPWKDLFNHKDRRGIPDLGGMESVKCASLPRFFFLFCTHPLCILI